ncbi:MAG: TetM/TetW/TetO/TetS family tetracycline resistance ribosomal protection protein [Lachnospiraceae bacterium]|nr:TetM/TetW/TetO/TetS family tetracycline resistance ribosomal protection protein [Lachnospiraceae bacterium]
MERKKHINLGIVAHVDAGKTTLTEAILYKTGVLRAPGRVDSRDTFLDTDEQERERGITIFSKQAQLCAGDLDITLLDTPGHVDFSAEAESVLQVLDYCILIISADDGVKGHALTLWSLLEQYNVPVYIFINKLDRTGMNKEAVLKDIQAGLSDCCVDFSHAPDLTEEDYEMIAMCDEALMDEYLETGRPIGDERIAQLIKQRKLFPVFSGSALKLEGVDELIEGLDRYTAMDMYPDEFAVRVYKITRDEHGNRLTHLKITGGCLRNKDMLGEEKVNQIRIYSGEKYKTVSELGAGYICAVTGLGNTRMGMGLGMLSGTNTPILEPVLNYRVNANDGTDDSILLGNLRILEEEDPQLIISFEENTKEIHARVMGSVQLEVLQRTVKDRFDISVAFDTGNVVYKETIKYPVEGVGHFEPLRHYAEVHLLLEPGARGSGLIFDSVCSEDVLDRNWQRLILTHLREKMHKGVLTGAPITDMKMTLITGRAHLKHTEGGDFRQATYRAVRQGLMSTESVLLEPYYFYRIDLPYDNVGRAMTDIEKMAGTVEAPQIEGNRAVLTGRAPVKCIGNYARELSAYTRGSGNISLSLAGYDLCHNAQEVIEASGYLPEADIRNTPDSVFCAHGAGFTVPWNEVRDYMHVESPDSIRMLIEGNPYGKDYEDEVTPEGFMAKRTEPAEGNSGTSVSLGTDEIDAILNKTFYSNSTTSARAEAEKRKGVGSNTKGRVVSTGGNISNSYDDYKYNPVGRRNKYLVVDGYNVIFAWQELRSLAELNIDSARDRLVDIMSNFCGATEGEVILVFDAYKVRGRNTSVDSSDRFKVVYTGEDETADQYIEKFASSYGRKYDVTVVTSDNLEQVIARGSGCRLISSREFESMVKDEINRLTDAYAGNSNDSKAYIGDIMPIHI